MILTDVEIAALQHLGGGISPRAVEAAVIKALAGVSVEPVAWAHKETGLIVLAKEIAKTSRNEERLKSGEFYPLYTADAIAAAHAAGRKSVHDSCVDLWKEEVIAAARVQALEEAANIAKRENAADWSISGQIAHEIRALIGKEST